MNYGRKIKPIFYINNSNTHMILSNCDAGKISNSERKRWIQIKKEANVDQKNRRSSFQYSEKKHPHPLVGSHSGKVKGFMTHVPSVPPDISLKDITRSQHWRGWKCFLPCCPNYLASAETKWVASSSSQHKLLVFRCSRLCIRIMTNMSPSNLVPKLISNNLHFNIQIKTHCTQF